MNVTVVQAEDREIDALLAAIRCRYHHEFRGYARTTLRRRVAAAMRKLGIDDVGELTERVLADPADFAVLLDQLTIQVSEMFRDPEWFARLRESVLPELARREHIRVWVAGCGNGEEAWSLAILLAEAGLLERARIYATDIDAAALERARAGIFPLERMALYSANYHAAGGTGSLADHYVAAYDGARFARPLGARTVFADHSLSTDSVFAEVDLVTCRNVLIYFDRELQDRALGLFRDALPAGGFLGLGARESLRVSAHADAFEEIAPLARIWRRRQG